MKLFCAVCLASLNVVTAVAHPAGMDGRWSLKKGNCSSESRIAIGPKTVDMYESSCRISKETAVNPLGLGKELDDYELKLACMSEGEASSETVYLFTMETTGQLKASFSSDGPNTHKWLYRCKR